MLQFIRRTASAIEFSLALFLLLAIPTLAQPVTTAPNDATVLELRDTSWSEKGGNIEVKGVVVNPTDYAVRNVQVYFDGLDGQGYPIANAVYKILLVPGGGSIGFDLKTVAGGKVKKIQLSIVPQPWFNELRQ